MKVRRFGETKKCLVSFHRKGPTKNLYSSALSVLMTDLKAGVETLNSQLSFVILKFRSMLKELPEGSCLA